MAIQRRARYEGAHGSKRSHCRRRNPRGIAGLSPGGSRRRCAPSRFRAHCGRCRHTQFLGLDQRQLVLWPCCSQGRLKGGDHGVSVLEWPQGGGTFRNPWRMFGDIAKGINEGCAGQPVHFAERHHCRASQAPSLARSSSVISVLLPSGMALLLIACTMIWTLWRRSSSREPRMTPLGGSLNVSSVGFAA